MGGEWEGARGEVERGKREREVWGGREKEISLWLAEPTDIEPTYAFNNLSVVFHLLVFFLKKLPSFMYSNT